MHWLSQAPSNIALIKYMGKSDEASNIPANASLSYTLNQLLSTVKLEILPGKADVWEPLIIPGGSEFQLSIDAQNRFIEHLGRIKDYFNYTGGFLIQSSNNFPHNCGLASSASSFAALTKCACYALSELTQKDMPSIEVQANLSRLGSGSSCRSFYSPWSLWTKEGVSGINLPYDHLIHEVIVISSHEKSISSREAHRRVKASSGFALRVQRAEENLKVLTDALMNKDWAHAYQICWREFHDMHQLFELCEMPFSYITPKTQIALDNLQDFWIREGDGPIVTMDAGPNIHLLYRMDQKDMAQRFKSEYLVGQFDVL